LKEIIDVLDLIPVLSEELLQLGKWLANETFSLYITTYQAMLPQVLKAKYEKEVVRTSNEPIPELVDPTLIDKDRIPYEKALQLFGYKSLQNYVERGIFTIQYRVK